MDKVDLEKGVREKIDAPKEQTIARDVVDPTTPYTVASFGIPLYSYNEAPHFLQGNPYITDGYRANLSTELCVKSSFICTNETVNIWSHIFGLVYFTFLMLEDNFAFLPDNNAHFGDHLTFTILNFCFQICMFLSAGYHLFSCQSEMTSKRWLGLDLAGVSVGLCGCYFPGAYYAFYCDSFWQTSYMVLMCTLTSSSLFAQMHPNFLSSHWYIRRLMLYAAIIFAGIVPVLHWIVISGGFEQPIVKMFMPKMIIMYILAFLGGTFYVSKFPESFFPGKVNLIGSSHQWWHIMVLLAFAWTHHCAVVIFLYWRVHECPSVTSVRLLAPPPILQMAVAI